MERFITARIHGSINDKLCVGIDLLTDTMLIVGFVHDLMRRPEREPSAHT